MPRTAAPQLGVEAERALMQKLLATPEAVTLDEANAFLEAVRAEGARMKRESGSRS